MTHLDLELQELKTEIIGMWTLVISQMRKTQIALLQYDKDIAREVIANEKRVNALELKVDRDCENIFALMNPVAVDLRFVLAILKINNNLERIGDIAKGMAKLIVNSNSAIDEKLMTVAQVEIMFETSIQMLTDLLIAFDEENTKLAREIFTRDEKLDELNMNANNIVSNYIHDNTDKVEQALNIHSSIRKLERIGDQCTNIAEEIIFYIEAKVLKHHSKKKEKK